MTGCSDAKSAVQNHQMNGWQLKTGEEVPWNFNGNEGTFYLDDETHYVIVYDAIVIGSGTQKFSNVADLSGFLSSKKGEKTYSSGSAAGGDVWEIKLLKYKDGLTSHGLQGATFQLFRGTGEYVQVSDDEGNTWWEEEKEPMKYGDTPTTREKGTVGENITFTTGSGGTVDIQVDQVRDGNEIEGGVHYFLKEIDSPSGYQIDSSTEYWAFSLTTDPDEVNYGDTNRLDEYGNRQWVYFYYNDILKMANTETHEPLDVVVNKTWYDKNGNEITGENLNESFVATVQLMRKTDDGDYVPVKVEFDTDGKPVITEVASSTEDSQTQLDYDNNWSYTWSQLPRVEMGGDKGLEVIHRYAYKIEEVSVDRFVQQAVAQVLTPIFEEQFHDHSYGFRPNRCAQQAVLKALEMMNDGHSWIVDIDECAIIGLTRKKLINTGFLGDVLFLLTLKIADKALRRRQYAQNRYLSAKRRITGSGGCDFGHTLQTDIHGRRHDQYSFAVDLCRRSVWHSSNFPVACTA